eukprot:CAMPEP_0115027624 /NCGR_PEP_ID=MMETSP0216-20121206/35668_1 /TAXON_ID=223996 /ORGANISM="Protocruzia adherens, Strain Boccale" /LENGTH=319 /DNA_ID=CAMNT_0002403357 /DNA_START=130 /DNA_END=1089 /DNA_ORIENTATION=+
MENLPKRSGMSGRGTSQSRRNQEAAASRLSSGSSAGAPVSKYSRPVISYGNRGGASKIIVPTRSSTRTQENSRQSFKDIYIEKQAKYNREIEELKKEDEIANKRIQRLKEEIATLEEENGQIKRENQQLKRRTSQRGQQQQQYSDFGTILAHLDQSEENGNFTSEERESMVSALRMHLQERLMMSHIFAGMGAEDIFGMGLLGAGEMDMDQFEDPNNPNVDNMSYEQLLELGDRIGKVSKGFSKEELDKLKGRTLTTDLKEADGSEKTCAICQCELAAEETALTLECTHEYHLDCIRNWLEMQKKCPTCMKAMDLTKLK